MGNRLQGWNIEAAGSVPGPGFRAMLSRTSQGCWNHKTHTWKGEEWVGEGGVPHSGSSERGAESQGV